MESCGSNEQTQDSGANLQAINTGTHIQRKPQPSAKVTNYSMEQAMQLGVATCFQATEKGCLVEEPQSSHYLMLAYPMFMDVYAWKKWNCTGTCKAPTPGISKLVHIKVHFPSVVVSTEIFQTKINKYKIVHVCKCIWSLNHTCSTVVALKNGIKGGWMGGPEFGIQ